MSNLLDGDRASKTRASYCTVLVIGAGESGVAVGCSLKRKLGFNDFRIVDRQSGIGGTWWINRYPGVACDIPTMAYSYSFAPNYTHKSTYSTGAEFLEYLNSVATKFDIMDKIQLNTDISELRYLEKENEWEARITHFVEGMGDLSASDRAERIRIQGRTSVVARQEIIRAKIVISCVGVLVEPNSWPKDIPKSNFKGQIIHPARWPKDVDFNDKHVVVIGAGCTAAQVVPAIAKQHKVQSLTQIIRTPPYMMMTIPPPFGKEFYARKAPSFFRLFPFIGRFARIYLFFLSDILMCVMAFKKSQVKMRSLLEKDALRHVTSVVPRKYHAMMTPKYPYGSKRRIGAPEWLESMNDPHFTLTNRTLKGARERTVILGPTMDATDGSSEDLEVPADIIILANGYNTTQFLHPLLVYGRSNKSIHGEWAERGGPQAYMGLALDNFPNFFMVTGPNTYTGHWSVILATENMTNYLLKIIKPILKGDALYAEVKRSAVDRWNEKLRSELKGSVFDDCKSWYRDEKGWNSVICPHSQIEATIRYMFPRHNDWDIIQTPQAKRKQGAKPAIYTASALVAAGALWRIMRR